MRARQRAARPRIVVADASYARHEPVREVLEDKGFEVLSQPSARNILAEVAEQHPDVVLLDEELVDHRPPNTIANIRAVSPETRVVVFASREATLADLGADAVVGKFTPPNGELTGALKGLVGVPAPRPKSRRLAVVAPTLPKQRPWIAPENRNRLVAVVAVVGCLGLLLWAFANPVRAPFFAGLQPDPAPPAAPAPDTNVAPPSSPVEVAVHDVRVLRHELLDGRYVLAHQQAGELVRDRQAVIDDGSPTTVIDGMIALRIGNLLPHLPPRVVTMLRDTLGSLLPPVVVSTTGTSATAPSGTATGTQGQQRGTTDGTHHGTNGRVNDPGTFPSGHGPGPGTDPGSPGSGDPGTPGGSTGGGNPGTDTPNGNNGNHNGAGNGNGSTNGNPGGNGNGNGPQGTGTPPPSSSDGSTPGNAPANSNAGGNGGGNGNG